MSQQDETGTEHPGTQTCSLFNQRLLSCYSGAFYFLTCICFWNISLFTWRRAGAKRTCNLSICTLKCHLTACSNTKPRTGLDRIPANWQRPEDYLASCSAILFSHSKPHNLLCNGPNVNTTFLLWYRTGLSKLFFFFFCKGLDIRVKALWAFWTLLQPLNSAFTQRKQP